MMEVFLTGTLWFKVPETHKYVIKGETKKGVYPRDVIQHIVREVGIDASVYSASSGTVLISTLSPCPCGFLSL